MLGSVDPRLEQAKRLIQNKQLAEARALLVGILKTTPTDTDALYIYALIARNQEDARKVLNRVLELDPLHYQARAALNKVQKRSVEQIHPMSPSGVSTSSNLLFWALGIIGFVIIATIAIAAFALIGLDQSKDESSDQAIVESSQQAALLVSPTETSIVLETRELPPTWTPEASATSAATRTPAPTLELQPSKTTVPTYTPTQPQIAAIELGMAEFSRLYTEYTELSAQATWTEDVTTLDSLDAALSTMIQSLELSEYDKEGVDPLWTSYLTDFVSLLNQQRIIVADRKTLIILTTQSQNTEDEAEKRTLTDQISSSRAKLDNSNKSWLVLQENVEGQLFALIKSVTATAQWLEQVDALRTPSVTPFPGSG